MYHNALRDQLILVAVTTARHVVGWLLLGLIIAWVRS